jgi:hypothetical protein
MWIWRGTFGNRKKSEGLGKMEEGRWKRIGEMEEDRGGE